MAEDNTNTPKYRTLIVITVMLVTIIEILDSTIVVVALPAMSGELGASSDQITWVLTSYIVASAILMPLTGFLIESLGRKRLLLINIAGFLTTSMLCGLSTNLEMIIVFRIFQGVFGAALVPISQFTLIETFSKEERNKAMAIWGIGIMVAPVLGPTLGGYITEHMNWRWIFYINVPVCIISFTMALFVIKETQRHFPRIDYIGLSLMAIGVGCLQILLDQGNSKGWLDSNFITRLIVISTVALFFFIVRSLQRSDSVVDLKLFANRNFALCSIMLLLFVGALFSTIAIQPIMLEDLMNYPVIQAGIVMAPRGFASAIAMIMVSGLVKKFGVKPLLLAGIALSAYGTYLMSIFSLNISMSTIIFSSVLQGFGMGLFFVPLTTSAFSTLPKKAEAEATGLFGFCRMLGASVGISILSTIVTRETQVNWHRLGGYINPFNNHLVYWLNQQQLNLQNPETTQRLAHELYRQSNMVAFIDGYRAIAIAFVLLVPLIFLLKGENYTEEL